MEPTAASRGSRRPSHPMPSSDFSTRFLASDGIPAYNALLDAHLGKRREFLLGNKRSLQHLQRTGAIARVEEKPENPNQYVVVMHERPAPSSAAYESIRRAPTLSHELMYPRSQGRPPSALKSVSRSESTPQFALTTSNSNTKRRARRLPASDDRDEDDDSDRNSDGTDSTEDQFTDSKLRESRGMGRSASAAALRHHHPPQHASPSALIDRLRRRRLSTPTEDTAASTPEAPRSTVERLLESDAAYQLKIQILRDEMRVLEGEKQYFERKIAKLRKRLRGVNAVHENDVAVAHCSAIMHARIVKAEEEFMKLVTAQQHVKRDIDALRRELLAMRKVTKKLSDDISDVEQANTAVADKIRAAKSVRNALSQELVELERRAEIATEEQRLKLPPEQHVVVDAHELMSAVQQQARTPTPTLAPALGLTNGDRRAGGRRSTVVLTAGSPLENLQRMLSEKAIVHEVVVCDKPLLSFRRAFRVIQQTLSSGDHGDHDDQGEEEALAAFVAQFEETEDALLSKHKLNAQLQEEVDQLEREAAELAREAAQRQAVMRGSQHVATAKQHELQDKITHTQERIEAYNELREVRNYEQTRLRAIMQRCLELLHAEKLVSSQTSLSGPVLLSELSPPAMLEALQKKMTEIAITLKLQHNASAAREGGDSDSTTSAKPTDRHTSVLRGVGGAAQRPSSATRRSNLLLKRETGSSTIVLGPREPSGAALKAILITAQPPTVEGAQVLSETHAAGMHALHPTIVSASAAPTRAPRKLTITRMASIRAGKRASALMPTGSLRRISAPVQSSAATDATAPSTANTRPSRVSMMWPVQRSSSKLLRSDSSTDSLMLSSEDAHAQVVESTDELDS